ncbi:hypothetical protein [Paraflavitalea speifideaquila]|uniref:hypothetical protein n=1 Tax=Paraflavitalea speifideaquila TaxID=3076558 RepID=UPI0028EE051B|nr:hypothetical protein [Paraflavitalea speifideiaquila]
MSIVINDINVKGGYGGYGYGGYGYGYGYGYGKEGVNYFEGGDGKKSIWKRIFGLSGKK